MNRQAWAAAVTLALLTAQTAAAKPLSEALTADTLYQGGPILTVDPQGGPVQAVAVKDGRILAVGSLKALQRAHRGPQTVVVDLAGRTLMPGFIDPHSHMAQLVPTWGSPSLSPPPVSDVAAIPDIITKLKAYLATADLDPGAPLIAIGYDDSLLAERRHPTARELDAVATDRPVIVVHQSGHLAAVNSKMLQLLGYTKNTPEPVGGIIRRTPEGDPDGVLEEMAAAPIWNFVPNPSMADQVRTLGKVQAYYASLGITTAQEGIATPADTALLKAAAKEKALLIDVVAYPRWDTLKDMSCDAGPAMLVPLKGEAMTVGVYKDRLKIGGVKLTGDGSPQGKTAYLTKPYVHPPHGAGDDYRGYPVATAEATNHWFGEGQRCGVQVLFHANGDAAADTMLAAVGRAEAQYGQHGSRPVMIHAQMIRHDQVDEMARLNIIPSFFTEHTFFWGDWHINETVGRARAFGMSPTGYALSKGIRFTIHTDAPVLPPNHLTAIWTAVNRVSRSGVVVGPDERISVAEAIKAVTLNAAYQYGEEEQKGSITPGKRADLIILDHNPMTVDPMTLKDIKVVETIKDGRTIFKAP